MVLHFAPFFKGLPGLGSSSSTGGGLVAVGLRVVRLVVLRVVVLLVVVLGVVLVAAGFHGLAVVYFPPSSNPVVNYIGIIVVKIDFTLLI